MFEGLNAFVMDKRTSFHSLLRKKKTILRTERNRLSSGSCRFRWLRKILLSLMKMFLMSSASVTIKFGCMPSKTPKTLPYFLTILKSSSIMFCYSVDFKSFIRFIRFILKYYFNQSLLKNTLHRRL